MIHWRKQVFFFIENDIQGHLFFNHHHHHFYYRFDNDDKHNFFIVVVDNYLGLKKGQQVFNCYGKRSNRFLLLWYGFCLKQNKYNSLTFSVRERERENGTIGMIYSEFLSSFNPIHINVLDKVLKILLCRIFNREKLKNYLLYVYIFTLY